MGYTHYWDHPAIDNAAWTALMADAKRVIDATDVAIRGGGGDNEPEFLPGELAINGSAELGEDYEDLVLTQSGTAFSFCKTAREPYDEVVAAILLRAALTVPGFRLRSDGTWGADTWPAACDLYAKAFGEVPTPPQSLTS